MITAAPTAKAAPARFIGSAWVDTITNGALPGSARLAKVWFAPSARTAWHRHVLGQTLHATDGYGLVRAAGEPPIPLSAGGTVYTPPGVWHWHGALRDHAMCHLTLSDSSPDPDVADVEWGELVSDADYESALHVLDTHRSPPTTARNPPAEDPRRPPASNHHSKDTR